MKNCVDGNVDEIRPKPSRPKRRKRLPRNVVEKNGKWFVRKNYSVEIKTESGEIISKAKQIWRICEPRTEDRARAILTSIENQLNARRFGIEPPLKNFGEICNRFAEAELIEASYGADGRKIAGRRSLDTPKINLKVIVEKFGHRQIDNISIGDIEDFKTERINAPVKTKNTTRPRSIRQVNLELSLLRQIFTFAYRRRYIDRIPFADGKNVIDAAAENRRSVIWSREEEAAALSLCTGKLLAHFKPAIICFVDGGFRRGELLNAKWTDCDFSQEFILAKSYKGRQMTIRKVFMTERMKRALLAWKREQKTIQKVSDTSLVIGYKSLKTGWNKIRKAIGREDLHIHDLRHVFGTRLLQAGANLREIQMLLGHSSIRTTERYLNPQTDDLRAAVNKLENLTLSPTYSTQK